METEADAESDVIIGGDHTSEYTDQSYLSIKRGVEISSENDLSM